MARTQFSVRRLEKLLAMPYARMRLVASDLLPQLIMEHLELRARLKATQNNINPKEFKKIYK